MKTLTTLKFASIFVISGTSAFSEDTVDYKYFARSSDNNTISVFESGSVDGLNFCTMKSWGAEIPSWSPENSGYLNVAENWEVKLTANALRLLDYTGEGADTCDVSAIGWNLLEDDTRTFLSDVVEKYSLIEVFVKE